MLEAGLDQVCFAYGSLQVLFEVSFTVRAGSMLALLGTNGAGKSTALRVLSGLAAPLSGEVRLDGRDVTGTLAEDMVRAGLAYVPGGRAVFPDMSVLENLLVGGHLL